MTTSGTFLFSPSVGELVLYAFGRIQVRRSEILQEHMENARAEGNFLLLEWANKGVNLWTVDLQSVPLVQGTATYSVPPETVTMLDAYIETTAGSGPPIDRMIFPISRTEYASYPNKVQQAPPTTFWFDRLIAPTVTLWPVPDNGGPYTLKYYRYRQIQDAGYASGQTPEIQALWLDAFAAGLAHRLSRYYAPQFEQLRKADAQEAWTIAATQNVEAAPLYIYPGTSSYWR